jgi:acetyltransferase-like isoleucine patch superfamily enzyme
MKKILIKIYNKNYKIITFIRNRYWRLLFSRFGLRSNIFGRIVVFNPDNIFFGSFSTINEGVLLNGRDKITIGDHVHVSPFCILNTGGLDYNKTKKDRVHTSKPIIIEDGVWIGSGVIVSPGVTIGENSVIGAGAVVTKDIPANTVALGIPAEVVKTIN